MYEKGIGRVDAVDNRREIGERALEYWQQMQTSRRRLFENLKESSIFYNKLLVNDGSAKNEDFSDLNGGLLEWKKHILPELKRWCLTIKESYVFLTKNGMSEYLDHDVANESTKVIGGSEMSVVRMESPEIDAKSFFRMLKVFLEAWERYWVAVEDVLIRRIDGEKVPEKCQTGIKFDSLRATIDYFEKNELKNIYAWSADSDSKYFGSDKRVFKVETDWEKLKRDLAGREIGGNEGVVLNFVLNSFRNGFKVNTESTSIVLNVEIVEDKLVIRVMDDGKGIDADSLNPDSTAFIFKKGSSKTNSTGLGLANFDKRLNSMEGELEVVSYRKDEGKTNKYLADGNEGLDLDEFNKTRWRDGKQPVKTVFEIRLPITKK